MAAPANRVTPEPRGTDPGVGRLPSSFRLSDIELPRLPARLEAPETRRGRRVALAIALVLAFLAVAWIASPLWVGLAVGTVMAFTTQGPYRRLGHALGGRRRLAASLVTIGAGLVCAGFAIVVFYVASHELFALVEYLRARIAAGPPSALLGDRALGLLARVGVDPATFDARFAQELETASGYAATAAARVVEAATGAVFGLIVGLVTMYYVLTDWPRIALLLESVLPLDPRHTRALILEFREVGRGTLVGTLGTALVQGTLAGVSFAVGGAPRAVGFGLLTTIASLLPVVGTGAVWGPVGVAQILHGHVAGGVFILVWGLCVVMTATDYVIRPRLVGRSCHVHPLLVLIALFGGIEVLGLAGLLVAPILMSLFVAVLRIYERESSVPAAAAPTAPTRESDA